MNPETLARRGDPATSHAAAAKQPQRSPLIRAAVLEVLTEDGPATHDQIVARYNRRIAHGAGYPAASASSIRTRTKELVRDGQVEQVPDAVGRSSMGQPAHLWRAVTVQQTETSDQTGWIA